MDIFNAKYVLICEQIEAIRNNYVPEMMTKFDDGEIVVPNEVQITYEGTDLQIPVKVRIEDESSACSVYQNKITYKASEIERFKGKEVFLVEFEFNLEGYNCTASSSTVIISKMPNKFKAFDRTFSLLEYNEVENVHVGDLYSQMFTVNFTTANKLVKAYYDDGFGEYDTAMPEIGSDENNPHCVELGFDKQNSCLTCLEPGEYSLGFAYLKHINKYVFYANNLETPGSKTRQVLIEYLQSKYTAHGNSIYVNVKDTVIFPETLEFAHKGIDYCFELTISKDAMNPNLILDGNKVTFNLDDEDCAYASIRYEAYQESPKITSSSYLGFKITK